MDESKDQEFRHQFRQKIREALQHWVGDFNDHESRLLIKVEIERVIDEFYEELNPEK